MKTRFTRILLATALLSAGLFACKKEKEKDPKPTEPTYSSKAAFYDAVKPKSVVYKVDAYNGGSFTTSKGTKVTVPAQAWIDPNGNPVLGNVNVEFLDLYSKTDIMLAGIHTMSSSGQLVSAGEFFIRAEKDQQFLRLAGGNPIEVEQPINGKADSAMEPWIGQQGAGGGAWGKNDSACTLQATASHYIFSLYKFSNPASAGTWCNSDAVNYFAGYTKTTLTLNADANQTGYSPDVYLIFKGVNSMVHVYGNGVTFPYTGAPVGLQCTVVAFGVKDGKLYASYTPITISANQNVTFTLAETTTDSFKSKMTELSGN